MIPYTTIPFASAFFLVMVGLFIGNLIWYRFRDEQEHLSDHLKLSNRQLKQRLREREQELVATSSKLETLQANAQQLAEKSDAAEYNAQQASLESHEASLQLSQERQAREDLAVCLSDEQQQASQIKRDLATAERALHELQAKHDDLLVSRDQLVVQHEALGAAHQKLQDAHAIEVQARKRASEAAGDLESQMQNQARSKDQLELERHSLREQIESLGQQLEAAGGEANETSERLATVNAELTRQREENKVLRARCQEVESDRDACRGELDRITEEFQAISFAKADLADRLVRREDEVKQLDNVVGEASLLRTRLRQVESSADASQSELDQSKLEVARLVDELDALGRSNQETEARLRNTLSHQEDELAQTRKSLKDQQAEAEEVASRAVVAETRCAELEVELQSLQVEVARAKAEAAQEHAKLQADAEANSNRLEFESLGLKVEVDTARKRITQLDQECEILRNERDQLQSQFDRLKDSSGEKDSILASVEEQLVKETARAEHLALGIATTESKLQALQAESERLERVEDELIVRDNELSELKAELAAVTNRCEHAVETEATTREIVDELRSELESRLVSLDSIEAKNDELSRQLSFERQETTRWQQSAKRVESHLGKERTKFDQLQQRYDAVEQELADTRNALSVSKVEAADFERRCQRAQERVEELASQLDEPRVESQRRKRRFSSLDRQQAAADRRFTFRSLRSREQEREKDQDKLIDDPSFGLVFVAPPSTVDNLQKISGVTELIEASLQQLGIYCYRQIGEWDNDIMLAIATRLNLGRLPWQHDWIAEARELIRQSDDVSAA